VPMMFEIGIDQDNTFLSWCESQGYSVSVTNDLTGIPRFLYLISQNPAAPSNAASAPS